MKITFLYYSFLSMLFFSCTTDREIFTPTIVVDPNSQLMYYWNFNTLKEKQVVDKVIPDFLINTSIANIIYEGSGAGFMDGLEIGYSLNSRNNDVAGSCLRFRNPSNTRSLILTIPTEKYKQIVLKFATARSGSGATTQNYSYSIDGINYTNNNLNTTTFNPSGDPLSTVVTIDFTAIVTANDNSNFKFKIEFTGDTASGTTGNNRFDNITLEGIPL